MTWKELKDHVLNLGFDEEAPSLASSVEDIMIVSANRAINLIHKTIVERYEKWFEKKLEDDGWELPVIKPITSNTPDTFKIQLPDKVVDLVPLLMAHYVWLDDDVQKASLYYNEYEQFRDRLELEMNTNIKLDFTGGLGW